MKSCQKKGIWGLSLFPHETLSGVSRKKVDNLVNYLLKRMEGLPKLAV